MNEQLLIDPVRTEIEELAEVILFQSVTPSDICLTPNAPFVCGGTVTFEQPVAKGGQTKGGGTDNQFDDNFENDGK